ncbi:hypothetical protein [Kocuria massiliensis]|uniref:hypothetical protein n=1 Tax=Kocuria massiliensis TaxID=1926282 RepID=UPI000A1C9536|nr:hypothetical protein [Kocuria massiliensis]
MDHPDNCETAKTYSCVCSCGGALHGAILTRGITTSDPARRAEAIEWAEPRRWTRMTRAAQTATIQDNVADRQPAVTGIVSELVITLVGQARDDAEIDVIAAMAQQISDEVGADFQRHLDGGGPDRRSSRHLWCVVLATICRLYDEAFSFITSSVDDLVGAVMMRLREDISFDRTDDTQARDIYQYKYRVVAAFELVEYSFLESLIKKAVMAVIAAAKTIGEESVFKHLRLIGVITCPDPDRHPDVIRHCLWPLLSGPFQDALQENLEIQMRTWLRNAYVVGPGS